MLFGKKDPICGMREKKRTGMHAHGKWFCHENCLNVYEKEYDEKIRNKPENKGCCH